MHLYIHVYILQPRVAKRLVHGHPPAVLTYSTPTRPSRPFLFSVHVYLTFLARNGCTCLIRLALVFLNETVWVESQPFRSSPRHCVYCTASHTIIIVVVRQRVLNH